MPGTKDTPVELNEESRVFLRRYKEAREYGFCEVDARMWAESHVESGQLRRLKRLGCSPKLAAKILREDP